MAEQLVYSADATEGTESSFGDEMRYDHYQVSVTLPIQKKKKKNVECFQRNNTNTANLKWPLIFIGCVWT